MTTVTTPAARRSRRRLPLLLAAVAAVVAGGLAVAVVRAPAAPAASGHDIWGATLSWALNNTASAGAYFGGCNFLSAGTAGNNGSSKVWTQTAPSPGFAAQAGNVTIEKPTASGTLTAPTWANKCTGPDGTSALTTTTSSNAEVRFANGTGTIDPAADTATIHWAGSFTSVFYGGMVYWSATDPTLTVTGGTGTLSATLSGYAASMDDATKWSPIAATTVTLASLSRVAVNDTGLTTTPAYAGVAVTTAAGDTAQVRSGAGWGSFPQQFIDFQHQTGESSYWYSSGLNDQDKTAAPITVAYPAVPDDGSSTTPSGPSTSSTSIASTTPPATPTPTTPSTSKSSTTGYHPSVHLDQTSVTAGGTITFSASGFAPGEQVAVAVHSDPVSLTGVTADGAGALSGQDTVPASVPAGAHRLVLTGRTSGATVATPLTVTATASCALTGGVKGGSLTWGFKKSFRSYVAAVPANSITATGGARILDADRAVAGAADSGTFLWPFTSSSAYTSPSSFTVQYGGKVEFKYPSHLFDIWIADPKVVVSGSTGVLYADVSLTVSEPGAAPSTTAHTAERLATISLAGTSPVSDSDGITRALHTAIADVNSFSFDGTAFYTKGQALDDATVLLSGCAGTKAASGTGDGVGVDPSAGGAGADGLGNDPNLVPDAQFRPDGAGGSSGLAFTGTDAVAPLLVAAILLAAGTGLLLTGRRRGEGKRP